MKPERKAMAGNLELDQRGRLVERLLEAAPAAAILADRMTP
jgi:hypothetical protein